MAKNIKELPLDDRPYEKLEVVGASHLTNSELLAIIIKTGTKENNCLDIARNILQSNKELSNVSDLEYLTSLSLEELKMFEGIGRVKAIQIKAVVELSKRLACVYSKNKSKILSPKDVFNILSSQFLGKKQEILKTILLNKNNGIISIVTNCIGSTDHINLTVKEILSEPIKQLAHGIVLSHNHPSGNPTPSNQDIRFTKSIYEYSDMFGIHLIDHIIIANDKYFSFKSENII